MECGAGAETELPAWPVKGGNTAKWSASIRERTRSQSCRTRRMRDNDNVLQIIDRLLKPWQLVRVCVWECACTVGTLLLPATHISCSIE